MQNLPASVFIFNMQNNLYSSQITHFYSHGVNQKKQIAVNVTSMVND